MCVKVNIIINTKAKRSLWLSNRAIQTYIIEKNSISPTICIYALEIFDYAPEVFDYTIEVFDYP